MKILAAPVCLLAGATILALDAPADAQTAEPAKVLATVAMIADVAQNVGGACAEVTAMMRAGADPHLYQPTASDVGLLGAADLILYVGYGLEGQMGEVLGRFAERTPTVAVAVEAHGQNALIADAAEYEGVDPHLWMDASLWAGIAPVIGAALTELRPGCADEIAANVETYTGQLQVLHEWVRESIASIPADQRKLVTAHDAFGYFSRAYGIEASEAIGGLSTEAEASIADIQQVAAFVVESGVPAVFVETTINPRTIEAMIAEVQAQGHEVVIGGELYSDAMGDPESAGGTYVGMIWENTVTITEALGGTVPPVPAALRDWAADWDIASSD